MSTHPADTYLAAFEALTPHTLDSLVALVDEDVRFRDPFNDCRGRPAFRKIFERMFEDVESPVFSVTYRISDAERTIAHWVFTFRFRGRDKVITGLSELTFDHRSGLLLAHVDYWDAAGQFYEDLPLLGPLLRWLRRRIAA